MHTNGQSYFSETFIIPFIEIADMVFYSYLLVVIWLFFPFPDGPRQKVPMRARKSSLRVSANLGPVFKSVFRTSTATLAIKKITQLN